MWSIPPEWGSAGTVARIQLMIGQKSRDIDRVDPIRRLINASAVQEMVAKIVKLRVAVLIFFS